MVTAKFLVLSLTAALLPLSYATPYYHSKRSSSAVLEVSLENGLAIQGTTKPTTPNVKQYLGIPYAQPPLGDLRFAPPQPYLAANGTVINGTVLPPSCMQYITNVPSMVTEEVPQFEIGSAGMSEDCLTISVWTPLDAEGLPVVIWFYGGGFTTGGTDVPYQLPEQWVERSQKHIVVAFNYRMNISGFPNSAGLEDQNLGLLDQRLAVEWTQQNIAKFGGGAERMIIWGQSAGSMAVDFYNFAWPSNPIVKGLAMDSGTAHLDLLKSVDTPRSNFSFVANSIGCANQTDSAAELACMRSLPVETIENFLHSYQDAGTAPSIGFSPIVDEQIVFGNYTEKALNGEMSDVPALMGFNENEGVFLLPFSTTGPNQTVAESLAYEYFWCPAVKTTYERLSANRTTHRYFWKGNFTNTSPASWMGAYHGSELSHVFGTHANFRGNSTAFQYDVSYAMQDAYLAFVSDPEHGLESVSWPAYEGQGGNVRIFAEGGVVAQTGTIVDIEDQCAELGLL